MNTDSETGMVQVESAESNTTGLGANAVVKTLTPRSNEGNDPRIFMKLVRDRMAEQLIRQYNRLRGIKLYISMETTFVKGLDTGNPQYTTPVFRSIVFIHTNNSIDLLMPHLDEAYADIMDKFETFERGGSDWTLEHIDNFKVHSVIYYPMVGTSYIPTPEFIENKKACINVHNPDDDLCFKWMILSALADITGKRQRVMSYANCDMRLDFTGISYPVRLDDIGKFEEKNDISVNVFVLEETRDGVYDINSLTQNFFPARITRRPRQRYVDTLLLQQWTELGEVVKTHYIWIKSLTRLLSKQRNTGHSCRHYCPYCLNNFTLKEVRDEHQEFCQSHGEQKVTYPDKDKNILQFTDYAKCFKIPYAIYVDFESLLIPLPTSTVNEHKSTKRINKHVGSAFSFQCVSSVPGESFNMVKYRGKNAAAKFVKQLLKREGKLKQMMPRFVPMNLTDEDKEKFDKANICHVCGQPFSDGDHDEESRAQVLASRKVRDHSHITGGKCNSSTSM